MKAALVLAFAAVAHAQLNLPPANFDGLCEAAGNFFTETNDNTAQMQAMFDQEGYDKLLPFIGGIISSYQSIQELVPDVNPDKDLAHKQFVTRLCRIGSRMSTYIQDSKAQEDEQEDEKPDQAQPNDRPDKTFCGLCGAAAKFLTGVTRNKKQPAGPVDKDYMAAQFKEVYGDEKYKNLLPMLTAIVANYDSIQESVPDVRGDEDMAYRQFVMRICKTGTRMATFMMDE